MQRVQGERTIFFGMRHAGAKPTMRSAGAVGIFLLGLCSAEVKPPKDFSFPAGVPEGKSWEVSAFLDNQQMLVAAWVGQEAISVGAVERLVRQSVGKQALGPLAHAVLQAQALEELVAQRLILQQVEREGQGPSPAQLKAALVALQQQIKPQHRSLQDFLHTEGIDLPELRRQLAWELYWPRRLQEEMKPERVEQYFRDHRRQFDGTQIHVSHILLRYPPWPSAPGRTPAEEGGSTNWEKIYHDLVAKAERIRQEILSGRLSFEEAAQRYSQAPTAAAGGRIGWIGAQGPMVASFTKAVFVLQEGQISGPVASPFGIHLIRCNKIRPGQKSLEEVRAQVEKALARHIREEIAAAQRRSTPVRYTGATAYWDPQTGQLVLPKDSLCKTRSLSY